jgi:hypothetical protein
MFDDPIKVSKVSNTQNHYPLMRLNKNYKKSMKKNLLNFAAGVVLMLAACKNEKQTAPVTITPVGMNSLASNITSPDPASNLSNPFDSVGAIHNEVVNATWNYMQSTGDTSISGRRNVVIRYFKTRYGAEIGTRLLQDEGLYKKDFPSDSTTLPNNRFNPATENYMNQILAKIHAITDASAYPAFKASMVSMEKTVMADRSLTVTQQQQILAVAAIARYSVSFWLTKAGTQPANGGADTMGIFRNFLRAVSIGFIDVTTGMESASHGESIQEIVEDASDVSSIWDAFL